MDLIEVGSGRDCCVKSWPGKSFGKVGWDSGGVCGEGEGGHGEKDGED